MPSNDLRRSSRNKIENFSATRRDAAVALANDPCQPTMTNHQLTMNNIELTSARRLKPFAGHALRQLVPTAASPVEWHKNSKNVSASPPRQQPAAGGAARRPQPAELSHAAAGSPGSRPQPIPSIHSPTHPLTLPDFVSPVTSCSIPAR